MAAYKPRWDIQRSLAQNTPAYGRCRKEMMHIRTQPYQMFWAYGSQELCSHRFKCKILLADWSKVNVKHTAVACSIVLQRSN